MANMDYVIDLLKKRLAKETEKQRIVKEILNADPQFKDQLTEEYYTKKLRNSDYKIPQLLAALDKLICKHEFNATDEHGFTICSKCGESYE